jgi:amidophosphoribosyltransferase
VGRIKYAMNRLKGAYSLTIMTRDALFGVRDPLGVRPLCLGRVNGGWVIASESCALDHIGASVEKEIERVLYLRVYLLCPSRQRD